MNEAELAKAQRVVGTITRLVEEHGGELGSISWKELFRLALVGKRVEEAMRS